MIEKKEKCRHCDGKGTVQYNGEQAECPVCHGEGVLYFIGEKPPVPVVKSEPSNGSIISKQYFDEAIKGMGKYHVLCEGLRSDLATAQAEIAELHRRD